MFPFAAPPPPGRRQFLLASAATAAGALHQAMASAAPAESLLLEPGDQELFRVRVEMEVEGNVHVPKNPLVSRKTDLRLPIKSDAVLDYEERYRRPPGADRRSRVTMVERYYHEAHSRSLLGRSQQTCKLRDSVRETIVRRELLPEVIYAVDDYFHRDELDLLRLPASSAAVDQLLPTQAVHEGFRYSPTAEQMVSVLNLTSVEANDVEAEVVSMSDADVKIQFRGNVDGSVEGVPTVLRTVGKLTFDRQIGACTWLAMAVHETREIGKAEPGFDVAATIRMIRKPLDQPIALAAAPPPVDITGKIPADRLYVDLTSGQLGVSAMMDRRWRMMSDLPGTAMMRMIENDRSIAQCDFRPLATLQPGTQWTLEAFQGDVRRTLGEQLSDLIEAEERLSPSGLRVLRVTAGGAVQGVAIQWVMLHFSDDTGRRVLATFTMEADHVEPFAGSDIQLASTLRFTDVVKPDAAEVAGTRPMTLAPPKIAEAKLDEDSSHQVQSASDLR